MLLNWNRLVSRWVFGVIAGGVFLSANPTLWAKSPDFAPLDRAYPNIEHPVDDTLSLQSLLGPELTASKSDLSKALELQTSVKAQEDRGTCSVFSALALLESYFIRNRLVSTKKEIDFSEQWLEYLVAKDLGREGSDSPSNFELISEWGAVRESTLPYLGEDWTEEGLKTGPLTRKRCGHLSQGKKLNSCLVGHFDPDALNWSEEELVSSSASELLPAKRESARFLARLKQRVGEKWPARTVVRTVSEIKSLLRAGIPLTLDIDFYFGAWNHREAEERGIPRDKELWKQGVIGYPEPGSVDRKKSRQGDTSGHSVLCVGYDDSIEVEVTSLSEDGELEQKRYRGVYFIKNSWGTEGFGSKFSAQGVSAPGYGMITQKYAHEFGGFYRIYLPELN